jgi:hypothetical protein
VRFVESALRVFGPDIESHRRGRCGARPAGLPLGGSVVSAPVTRAPEPAGARSARRLFS